LTRDDPGIALLEESVAVLRGSPAQLELGHSLCELLVFVLGEREPLKAVFSRAHDVVLANPFGPAVQGWDGASAAVDYASSRLSDGVISGFHRRATYVAPDLATIYEVEEGKMSVGGGPVTPWVLRTTTTFRREDGTWKVVHRHADPISTANPEGPLRSS
jgi:ketosteroid isomerase-like protein